MSAVETLALVLLHVVVAVLPLGGRQTHGLRLRLKLLDAADSGQVAIQFGGHIAGLQQFGAEIQRWGKILVALQPILLVVPMNKQGNSYQRTQIFLVKTYASAG